MVGDVATTLVQVKLDQGRVEEHDKVGEGELLAQGESVEDLQSEVVGQRVFIEGCEEVAATLEMELLHTLAPQVDVERDRLDAELRQRWGFTWQLHSTASCRR